ncbi:MAG TPA: orotate phosphoribosyltransferase [Actinomycetes bacterium]|nr:orotate phosphoribosyltransferase [Actinomycetes bacterium]
MSSGPPDPPGALTEAAVLRLFEQTGGLRRGHFVLSSGRHGDTYLQCAVVLQWPAVAEALGRALADRSRQAYGDVGAVVGPAMGGIVIGHEVARALGVRMLFAERRPGGGRQLALRRSFALRPGERALIVEDVVTTGGSVVEVAGLVERAGGEVAGTAAIVDRPTARDPRLGPVSALVRVETPAWEPGVCPRCAEGMPVEAPGSRQAAAPEP